MNHAETNTALDELITPLEGEEESELDRITAPLQEAADTTIPERQASDRAFYASSLVAVENRWGDYYEIKADIENFGKSQKYEDAKNFISGHISAERKLVLEEQLSSPSINVSEAEGLVAQFIMEENGDVDMAGAYIKGLINSRVATSSSQRERQALDLKTFDMAINVQNYIQAEQNRDWAASNDNVGVAFLGILEMMLPGLEGSIVNTMRNAALDDQSWWDNLFNLVLVGEGKKNFREALSKLPPLERIEAVRRGLEAVKDLPGVTDMAAFFTNMDLVGSEDYPTYMRYIDNFIGLLDATFIGMGVSAVLKVAFKGKRAIGFVNAEKGFVRINPIPYRAKPLIAPNSPMGRMGRGDPEKAGDTAIKIIMDETGHAAYAMGTTKEEVLFTYILPKAMTESWSVLPPHINEMLRPLDEVGLDVGRLTSTGGINYTKDERIASRQKYIEGLKDATSLTYRDGKSVLEESGERFKGVAVYGNDSSGLSGYNTALDRARKDFGQEALDDGSVFILKEDSLTKNLEQVTKGEKTGQFYIGQKYSHAFDPSDALIYGQSSVGKALFGIFRNGYVQDITARYAKEISARFLSADRKTTSHEKRLFELFGTELKKLKRKQRIRLSNALEEGSKKGKIFSPVDLATDFKMESKAERDVYYKYRRTSDILWSLTNFSERRRLKSKGFVEISNDVSDYRAFGKEVENAESITRAYDPQTGKIIDIEGGLQEGQKIFDLGAGAMKRADDDYTQYVIVDGIKTKAGGLPDIVTPYLKGYYGRSYKETHFIDLVPTSATINGRLVVHGVNNDDDALLRGVAQTIGAFPSKLEANAAKKAIEASTIKKLEETGEVAKNEFMKVRKGEEFNFSRSAESVENDLHARQFKHTKRRGEWIGGLKEGKATIDDPVQALFNGVNAVSKTLGTQDLLHSSKQRWLNTFNNKLKRSYFKNGYPKVTSDIKRDMFDELEDYRNAVALHELTSTIERVPSLLSQKWKSTIFDLSESMESIFLPGSKFLREHAIDFNPARGARNIASIFYIALRPGRQILVQAGQLTQFSFMHPKYMFGLGGKGSPSFSRELAALSFSRATYGSKNAATRAMGEKYGAKMFGVSEEEYRVITNEYFRRSGLPESVDTNAFVDGMIKDVERDLLATGAKGALRSITRPLNKAVEIGRRLGFDPGEFVNLTGSWLLARRKFIDANPNLKNRWHEKEFADKIAAQGTALSYAMTQSGTLKYQRGILAVPMQFWSVPHKAMLSVLPEAWGGSKTLSRKEKIQVGFANLTLFGGAAFGLSAVSDAILKESGLDLPEHLRVAFRGGLFDTMGNWAIRTAFSEPDAPLLAVGDAFNPSAKYLIPGIDAVVRAFTKNEYGTLAFGASSSLLDPITGRFRQVFDDLYRVSKHIDLSTPQKLLAAAETLAQLPSGTNDLLLMRAALRLKKEVSSSGGNKMFEVQVSTALAHIVGIAPKANKAIFEAAELLDDSDIVDAAKRTFKSYNRLFNKIGLEDSDRQRAKAMSHELLGLDQRERDIYVDTWAKEDQRSILDTGTSVGLRILKRGMRGGAYLDDVYDMIRIDTSFPEEAITNLKSLVRKATEMPAEER